jgi:proton-dependent oligopeptide transporter, POT family
MSTTNPPKAAPTLFGHPAGLFTLFFAEMWERFSFYGMRALLILYMGKGFLQYADKDATAVYGAYTALVYMAPFFGGMLADRLLGARRSVVVGGLLMAAGEMLLMIPHSLGFFTGLALLICGNGFFKPNISTIVGSLYPQGSPKRDGGFTIFYMGINLGAAMSPLLCGYIGETLGWWMGFGLAAIGMLIGAAIFAAPTRFAQATVLIGAAFAAVGLVFYHPASVLSIAVNVFVSIVLLIAAVIAAMALGRGGLPAEAGAPPDRDRLRKRVFGPISAEWAVYLGAALSIVVFVLLVSGFSPLTRDHRPMTIVPESVVKSLKESSSGAAQVLAVVVEESSRPAGLVLVVAGLLAFGYIVVETFRLDTVPRQRMYVILILTFFSMLFWSFFEQAGSSLNNFTDRNVNRVLTARKITTDEVGKTIHIQPTQEQLGYHNGGQLFTMDVLDRLRDDHKEKGDSPNFEIDWAVTSDDVGMGIAQRSQEVPASIFQAVNPIYILFLGLVFTMLWTALASVRMEPGTTAKFAMGLLQLGLGFGVIWLGTKNADDRGMVAVGWLMLGYLLQTMGELCLSPVGLSMVTRLSPRHLVSTVMGAWFLATAFSQFLAAIIAQFTGVTQGGDGAATIPVPRETVHIYGNVFGKIAISAIISSVICFALAPILNRWMHPEADRED